jgi:hypothetical protein
LLFFEIIWDSRAIGVRRATRAVTLSLEALLDITLWLPVLACAALAVYLLLHRTSASMDGSPTRLALLVGTQRAFGETDASLRRRSIALSRWPYTKEKPVLVWWGRLWARIRPPL